MRTSASAACFVVDDGRRTSIDWSIAFDEVFLLSAGELQEAVDSSGSDRSLVVDLTSADDIGGFIERFSSRFARRRGIAGFVCTPVNVMSVYRALAFASGTRVFCYHPVLYEPATLRSIELIARGDLGHIVGLEISMSCPKPFASSLGASMMAANYLGPVSGARIEKMANGLRGFYWTDRSAVSLRIVEDTSIRLNASVVCKDGVCRFDTIERSIEVIPAGGRRYAIVLPEGDGMYYFVRDISSSLLSGGRSRIVPFSLVEEASRIGD